jgi:hypothetical protein
VVANLRRVTLRKYVVIYERHNILHTKITDLCKKKNHDKVNDPKTMKGINEKLSVVHKLIVEAQKIYHFLEECCEKVEKDAIEQRQAESDSQFEFISSA